VPKWQESIIRPGQSGTVQQLPLAMTPLIELALGCSADRDSGESHLQEADVVENRRQHLAFDAQQTQVGV
jgi:hypothetical protein